MLLALLLAQLLEPASPEGPIVTNPAEFGPMLSIGLNGNGFPTVTQLCDTLTAADEVGDWFCLKGDGTMLSGSQQTLSQQGSVSFETVRFCPNGPDCSPGLRHFRTPAEIADDTGVNSGFAGANVATGTSDFTVCQEILAGTSQPYENYFHKGNTVSGIDLLLQRQATTTNVGVFVGAGNAGSITLTIGVRHIMCVTVVAGAGTAVIGYLDGTQVFSGTGTLTNSTGPYRVSGYAGGNFPTRKQSLTGDTFMTRTVLSAARIAAISHRVLADQPATSRGDLVETDRSTVRSCKSSDGAVISMIPSNRACIAGGRYQVRPTRINSVLQNTSMTTTWTTTVSGVAAPTITEDFAIAPDGTKTADRIQIPATSGGQYSLVQQSGVFAGSVAASASISVAGNGTSGTTCISLGSQNGMSCLCTFTPYPAFNRCKCENKTPPGADFLYFGNYSGAAPGACTGVAFSAVDVIVWAAQGEAGATASSPILTYTASVQHLQEVDFKFPKAHLVSNGIGSNGCMAASYIQHGTVSSPIAALGWMDSSGRALYVNSTWRTYDGTTEPAAAAGLTVDVLARGRAKWSGSTLAVANLTSGVSASGAFDGSMATTGYPTASYFSFCSGSAALGAAVGDYECGNVVWDTRPEFCK
ncbi:MAG: hypothetical protein QM817_10355 [Archangium sp.]